MQYVAALLEIASRAWQIIREFGIAIPPSRKMQRGALRGRARARDCDTAIKLIFIRGLPAARASRIAMAILRHARKDASLSAHLRICRARNVMSVYASRLRARIKSSENGVIRRR